MRVRNAGCGMRIGECHGILTRRGGDAGTRGIARKSPRRPFPVSPRLGGDLQPATSDLQPPTCSPSTFHSRLLACRQFVDALVCLALAVILFRAFEVEGYLISTGSMAPSLLGLHKRVICPACRFQFALGIAQHEAAGAGAWTSGAASPSNQRRILAVCPNCGQGSLNTARVPPNQGDQLLVHKHAYLYRQPRRWEIIVFRNPQKLAEAYVKRVVGLPGESVQIIDGDVYIGGRLQRKSLTTQRAIRIPVYDCDYQPHDDPEWRPRWLPEPTDVMWEPYGNGFVFDGPAGATTALQPTFSWVAYRHSIRSGGQHETSVPLDSSAPLDDWLQADQPSGEVPLDVTPADLPIRYDRQTQRLVATGVLSDEWRDRLLARSDDADFITAVEELYEQSHIAPITDVYGYNRVDASDLPIPVRDLMFSAQVVFREGRGEFVLQMTDGRDVFDCVFDRGHSEVRLRVNGGNEPVRTARLPMTTATKPLLVEMSLMDRQVLVGVDGRPIFAPWKLSPLKDERHEWPRQPVRFGASDLQMYVRSLKLFRDVYYTSQKARNGVEHPYRLGPDEYFVLGDNSPISSDSRVWRHGGVSARLLLGKPFVVHLPSRPGKIRIGDSVGYIRVPDFARIRYIR